MLLAASQRGVLWQCYWDPQNLQCFVQHAGSTCGRFEATSEITETCFVVQCLLVLLLHLSTRGIFALHAAARSTAHCSGTAARAEADQGESLCAIQSSVVALHAVWPHIVSHLTHRVHSPWCDQTRSRAGFRQRVLRRDALSAPASPRGGTDNTPDQACLATALAHCATPHALGRGSGGCGRPEGSGMGSHSPRTDGGGRVEHRQGQPPRTAAALDDQDGRQRRGSALSWRVVGGGGMLCSPCPLPSSLPPSPSPCPCQPRILSPPASTLRPRSFTCDPQVAMRTGR